MPFAVVPGSKVVDSRDWTGISARQIVHDVTHGFVIHIGNSKVRISGIRGGSVIGFHDSAPGTCLQQQPLCSYVMNTIRSLQGIVDYMNAHHLGVTVQIPANATGGAVPNIPVG